MASAGSRILANARDNPAVTALTTFRSRGESIVGVRWLSSMSRRLVANDVL
jgi:hypothetical protein